MPGKLYFIESQGTDAYGNIALEEMILQSVPPDACVLYLWQNAKTVVIGRNQCAWRECHVEALQAEGGTLARRLSGGGAVYHDLGNLNFTFVYPRAQEDIAKQVSVIAHAVSTFGLAAQKTGRNDIEIDGRKFSGNAYHDNGTNAYHHGTIMLHVDAGALTRFLQVDPRKYQSKGVSSLRSRVVNLQDLNPDITVDAMKDALKESFSKIYGGPLQAYPGELISPDQLAWRRAHFASWDWVYGRPIGFTWAAEERFAWGNLRLEMEVDRGVIQRCNVFSDALSIQIGLLSTALQGCPFHRAAVTARLDQLAELPEMNDARALMDSELWHKEASCTT
ncbi:MAG: lipoate--protein ligase [Christensenellales bacterium]